jgi:hypothetical protein
VVSHVLTRSSEATGACRDRRRHRRDRDHHQKKEIKEDVEEVLPPGSSGIVALFEERWVEDVEKALANADQASKHEVDSDSAEEIKASASSET